MVAHAFRDAGLALAGAAVLLAVYAIVLAVASVAGVILAALTSSS